MKMECYDQSQCVQNFTPLHYQFDENLPLQQKRTLFASKTGKTEVKLARKCGERAKIAKMLVKSQQEATKNGGFVPMKAQ